MKKDQKMKKIILLSIGVFLISSGNASADTIQEYYNKVSNNRASSYLEKRMESEAMACSKGNNKACIALGVGSFASSLWRLDKILIDVRTLGKSSKSVKVLKKIKKILKEKKLSDTKRKNGSTQSRYTLILPKTNINGHQVIIYVTKNNKAYIQTDGKRVNMVKNENFRSTAKILSLLPSNIRNNSLLRKNIISAKIQWRNQMR